MDSDTFNQNIQKNLINTFIEFDTSLVQPYMLDSEFFQREKTNENFVNYWIINPTLTNDKLFDFRQSLIAFREYNLSPDFHKNYDIVYSNIEAIVKKRVELGIITHTEFHEQKIHTLPLDLETTEQFAISHACSTKSKIINDFLTKYYANDVPVTNYEIPTTIFNLYDFIVGKQYYPMEKHEKYIDTYHSLIVLKKTFNDTNDDMEKKVNKSIFIDAFYNQLKKEINKPISQFSFDVLGVHEQLNEHKAFILEHDFMNYLNVPNDDKIQAITDFNSKTVNSEILVIHEYLKACISEINLLENIKNPTLEPDYVNKKNELSDLILFTAFLVDVAKKNIDPEKCKTIPDEYLTDAQKRMKKMALGANNNLLLQAQIIAKSKNDEQLAAFIYKLNNNVEFAKQKFKPIYEKTSKEYEKYIDQLTKINLMKELLFDWTNVGREMVKDTYIKLIFKNPKGFKKNISQRMQAIAQLLHHTRSTINNMQNMDHRVNNNKEIKFNEMLIIKNDAKKLLETNPIVNSTNVIDINKKVLEKMQNEQNKDGKISFYGVDPIMLRNILSGDLMCMSYYAPFLSDTTFKFIMKYFRDFAINRNLNIAFSFLNDGSFSSLANAMNEKKNEDYKKFVDDLNIVNLHTNNSIALETLNNHNFNDLMQLQQKPQWLEHVLISNPNVSTQEVKFKLNEIVQKEEFLSAAKKRDIKIEELSSYFPELQNFNHSRKECEIEYKIANEAILEISDMSNCYHVDEANIKLTPEQEAKANNFFRAYDEYLLCKHIPNDHWNFNTPRNEILDKLKSNLEKEINGTDPQERHIYIAHAKNKMKNIESKMNEMNSIVDQAIFNAENARISTIAAQTFPPLFPNLNTQQIYENAKKEVFKRKLPSYQHQFVYSNDFLLQKNEFNERTQTHIDQHKNRVQEIIQVLEC